MNITYMVLGIGLAGAMALLLVVVLIALIANHRRGKETMPEPTTEPGTPHSAEVISDVYLKHHPTRTYRERKRDLERAEKIREAVAKPDPHYLDLVDTWDRERGPDEGD